MSLLETLQRLFCGWGCVDEEAPRVRVPERYVTPAFFVVHNKDTPLSVHCTISLML